MKCIQIKDLKEQLNTASMDLDQLRAELREKEKKSFETHEQLDNAKTSQLLPASLSEVVNLVTIPSTLIPVSSTDEPFIKDSIEDALPVISSSDYVDNIITSPNDSSGQLTESTESVKQAVVLHRDRSTVSLYAETERQSLLHEIESLKDTVSALTRDNDVELLRLSQEIDELNEKLTVLNGELLEANNIIDDLGERLKTLDEAKSIETRELSRQIVDLNARRKIDDETSRLVSIQTDELTEQLEAIRSDKIVQTEQLETIKSDNNELTDQLETIRRDKSELTEQLETIKHDKNELELEVSRLHSERSTSNTAAVASSSVGFSSNEGHVEGAVTAEPDVVEGGNMAEPDVVEGRDKAEPHVVEGRDKAEPGVADGRDKAELGVESLKSRLAQLVSEVDAYTLLRDRLKVELDTLKISSTQAEQAMDRQEVPDTIDSSTSEQLCQVGATEYSIKYSLSLQSHFSLDSLFSLKYLSMYLTHHF